MERIEHQTLLFLIFSIITAKYYSDYKEQKHSNSKKIVMPLMLVGGIGAIALSFVVSTKRYAGEQNMVHIYDAHRKVNWTELIQIVDGSINPYYKIDPMSIPLHWYKGVALFSLGNLDEAKENFEEAKDLTPYNIHVLNNLASCFEKLGDHNTAIEYYQKAISISSGFKASLLNLSAVYYNIGQYEKAFDAIDKCSVNSVDPKYKAFLPIILKSKLEMIQLRDGKVDGRNSSFASEKLLEMYFDSKKENGTF